VQISGNDRDEILAGTTELVTEVMGRNELSTDDVISVLFTATPDLTAEFPALAARKLGFQEVPLLCAAEIDVPGAMPRVVRLMMHIETSKRRSELTCAELRRSGWTSRNDRGGPYIGRLSSGRLCCRRL
jgi:chorismate mutase